MKSETHDMKLTPLLQNIRMVLGIVAAVYLLLFIFFNGTATANVWYLPFVEKQPVPTLVLIVLTALATVVIHANARVLYRWFRRINRK